MDIHFSVAIFVLVLSACSEIPTTLEPTPLSLSSTPSANDPAVLTPGLTVSLTVPTSTPILTATDPSANSPEISSPPFTHTPCIPRLTPNVNVNVREGPSTNYRKVGVLVVGDTAEVVGRNNEETWWVIRWPNVPGEYGWVSDLFVDVDNVECNIIIMTPPPIIITPMPDAVDAPGLSCATFDVFHCQHVGGDRFEWYQVEICYENGTPVKEETLDGPFSGYWQPNCPPLPESPEPPTATPCTDSDCDSYFSTNSRMRQLAIVLGWVSVGSLLSLIVISEKSNSSKNRHDRRE